MTTSIISDFIDILSSKTWFEWFDEFIQFIISEIPSILSECAQKLSSSLVDTISF